MWQRTEVREASQSRASDSPSPGEDMGEGGCLFDEMGNLVEPTERRYRDVPAGPQRGTMPKRRGANSPARRRIALEKKPFILIDARKTAQGEAADAVVKFIEENGIQVLNVAGPRASGWALGHAYAMAVVGRTVAHFQGQEGTR